MKMDSLAVVVSHSLGAAAIGVCLSCDRASVRDGGDSDRDATVEDDASRGPLDSAVEVPVEKDAESMKPDASQSSDSGSPQCSAGKPACSWSSSTDSIAMSLFVQPADEDGDGRSEHLLTIDGDEPRRHLRIGPSEEAVWAVEIPVRASPGGQNALMVIGERPFSLSASIFPIVFSTTGVQSECALVSGGERVRLAQGSLRTTGGDLLLAYGHAPLKPDGSALLSGDAPELSLSWANTECTLCTSPPGPLEITFRSTSGNAETSILPGSRGTLWIGEHEFTVMSSGSVRPRREDLCGYAFWTVVRNDSWVAEPDRDFSDSP